MRIVIDWRSRARDLALLMAIGTFLAFISPYQATARMPFWMGWLYWTGLTIYGSVVGGVATDQILKHGASLPRWATVLLISLITAAFVTPVIVGLQYMGGAVIPWAYLPQIYFFVWVISAGITGVGYLRHQMLENQKLAEEREVANPTEKFMSRLPLPFRAAELYALSSEDHYLRVHTSAGEHLFLEKLRNAVHQLEDADGMQVHRSWWVAAHGVETAQSQNGRIALRLKSGAEAPVSRSFTKAVKEAGWV